MTRAEAWLLHASTLLVGGTGVVYAWMRYFAKPTDPEALANHPWQPATQGLHVVLAPALVFACGLVWRDHVWTRIRSGYPTRRRSGISLALVVIPMIASGYLLQVSGGEPWRAIWIGVHLAASGGWLLGYALHQLSPA